MLVFDSQLHGSGLAARKNNLLTEKIQLGKTVPELLHRQDLPKD